MRTGSLGLLLAAIALGGSPANCAPVIVRCRLNVRIARKRTWNMHRHGSNVL
jgi:hypothetical protein